MTAVVKDCHACHGRGVVRVRFVDNRHGHVQVITCPDCEGRGSWIASTAKGEQRVCQICDKPARAESDYCGPGCFVDGELWPNPTSADYDRAAELFAAKGDYRSGGRDD